jgi:LPP20 lipoprotein
VIRVSTALQFLPINHWSFSMKKIYTLTAVAVALALAGCAKQKKTEEVAACTFPGSSQKAPSWVCGIGGAVEGAAVWAAGSYQKTQAGVAFQEAQAMLNGRAQLVQQMRSVVSSGVKQATQTTGSGSSETVDQVASNTAKLISSETLVGSRKFAQVSGPDGTLYVLVGVDEAAAKRVVQQAVQTSMNNDRAQWQQFQGAKLQADLAAEVYKLGTQTMR